MDLLTLLGVLLAVLAVVVGQMLDGGHLGQLLNTSAFLIVMGGTLGAVILQTKRDIFLRAFCILPWIVVPPKLYLKKGVERIVGISERTRKSGLLIVEKEIKSEKDPFFKKALSLITDGSSPAEVRNALTVELESEENRDLEACNVYESMGGYSPTIGILGTVMGLMHVMDNLTNTRELGAGIAVAFIATIYGVGFANLLFLPIANKLRVLVARRARIREMIIEGFTAISEGEHPKVIETRLKGFLGDA